MYALNSLVIAFVLFVFMVLVMEAGYRIGQRSQVSFSEAYRSHLNTIQSSLLGVLALLLGFTFSLALQRFDSRSEAVVDEANAIGTAYLRAQLLPATYRDEAEKLLQSYVGLRAQAGAIALSEVAERKVLLEDANRVIDQLWGCAMRAVQEDKNPATTGLFIQALNEAIDSYGRRDAELNRHVPEVIFLLLYCVFVVTSGVLGYSAGVSEHRPSLATYILVVLIVIATFIIIDLDRPRRGLIRVDQTNLVILKKVIEKTKTGESKLPALSNR